MKKIFLKYVNYEEEKYSDKELKFNIINSIQHCGHKDALWIYSNSCVSDSEDFSEKEGPSVRTVRYQLKRMFLLLASSAVSSPERWLCSAGTGPTTNSIVGSIQHAELNVWGQNGLNTRLLSNLLLVFSTSWQLSWVEFGKHFSRKVIIDFFLKLGTRPCFKVEFMIICCQY